jgi:hypothetical protein
MEMKMEMEMEMEDWRVEGLLRRIVGATMEGRSTMGENAVRYPRPVVPRSPILVHREKAAKDGRKETMQNSFLPSSFHMHAYLVDVESHCG